MKTLAGFVGVVTLASGVALVCACGGADSTELFSAAVDASSSTSSTSSTSSSTSSSSGGADASLVDASSSSGGLACVPGVKGSCGAGFYCEAQACSATTGTCTAKPVAKSNVSAVCGCNGVTYFSATVAANADVSTRASGECDPAASTTVKCTAGKCQNGQSCNLGAPRMNAMCGMSQFTCWQLPAQCSPNDKNTTRGCQQPLQTCASLCEAVKAEKSFYLDAGAFCP